MGENERLDRIEQGIEHLGRKFETIQGDVSSLRADMSEIKGHLPHLATKAEVEEIKGALTHLATKAEVEKAKHDATKGKYGLLSGLLGTLLGVIALAARFWTAG